MLSNNSKWKRLETHLATCAERRSFDGSGNNVNNPSWGKAGERLLRCTTVDYADGISALAVRTPNNANPREISNQVCKSTANVLSKTKLTDTTWQFGQFVDHKIDHTPTNDENINITVAANDPDLTSGGIIPLTRSQFDPSTGTDANNPRQQINSISSYLDGSSIYGSDQERVETLRLHKDGLLDVSFGCDGALPPYNSKMLENATIDKDPVDKMYLCGDVRGNENAVLLSIHTLFVREHQRKAREIAKIHPKWSDDMIFHYTRRFVIGYLQNIVYSEYLPALFGENNPLPEYSGYDDTINAGICNEFSTCLYRLGHTMVSGALRFEKPKSKCVGYTGEVSVEEKHLDSLFFKPSHLLEHGIAPLLVGGTNQIQQEIDIFIVEELRSRLFGPQAPGLLMDLAAINIQRGRDHGLPNYNAMRVGYGLAPKASIDDITTDQSVRDALRAAYGLAATPDSLDPWIGALAEDHVDSKCSLGELLLTGIREQFLRLRDGDRFYFENDVGLPEWAKQEIRQTKLSDIYERNFGQVSNLRKNIFVAE